MRANLKSSSHQRCLWKGVVALALFAALAPASAHARARHSDAWARAHFATASRMREALNGRPPAERTRREYQHVVNAFRAVFLGAPASTKAEPSVVAVAETLVEMGRHFDDDKILRASIEQYKFLRREYPGSRYRFDGLFTIGEIYKDDLDQPEAARATFEDFLRRYPRNRLADGARQAIVDLSQAKTERRSEVQNANGQQASKEAAANDSLREQEGKQKTSDARVGLPRITGIRHWSTADYTRVAIDMESDVKFSSRRIAGPSRIFFDLHDARLASTLVGKTFDVDDGFLKEIRVAQSAPRSARIVLEIDNSAHYDAFLLANPCRLIIDIRGKKSNVSLPETAAAASTTAKSIPAASGELTSSDAEPTLLAHSALSGPNAADVTTEADGNATSASAPPALSLKPQTPIAKKIVDADGDDGPPASHAESAKRNSAIARRTSDVGIREARPRVSGDRSLIRALGLKIGKIVIDPGHGGHDTGTIGPNGLEEKDLVLEVSRRLGKLLETRLGAEVVYTRKDDTFIPLETRTAIANQARADLFVSIHANSSHDAAARGVETYYLNFTSSPAALEVAARENAVSEKSIYELQDLVKKIALKEKIEESREFAWDVQQSLHSGLAIKTPAIRDRGVKKAPFIVLIGANMPSILAEISFVSNPADEHRLATSEYRQRIAESLYRGIARYVNGLSGVKVASKMDKAAGQ